MAPLPAPPISRHPTARHPALATALASMGLLVGVVPAAAVDPTTTGPSSSQAPHIVPVAPGVRTVSLLTVGDAVGPDGYRMVGTPDGLGAYANDDGTFSVLMNHELGVAQGIVRDHGAAGAFASRWTIDASTLQVLDGGDLIQSVVTSGSTTLGRLCSADLPARSATYNEKSKQGYDGELFLHGEEVGTEGRVFATTLDGVATELPSLGKFSWENALANPSTGNHTLVIGTDDSSPGELHVYLGHKRKDGTPAEQAGLVGGDLYGLVIPGHPVEDRFTAFGADSLRFELVNHGDVSAWTGADLQAADDAAGVTAFLRPEDGAWDPSNPDDFYFVTTDRFDPNKRVQNANDGLSRLWRLRFDNARDPAAGGWLDMLIDGTGPQQSLDNLTIDRHGHVYIQEDPGNRTYIAVIWRYDIVSDTATLIAQHDPARFTVGLPGFLTTDEESSGIIDASDVIGPGWFLLDVQVARDPGDPELVDGGQLLALYDPAADPSAVPEG